MMHLVYALVLAWTTVSVCPAYHPSLGQLVSRRELHSTVCGSTSCGRPGRFPRRTCVTPSCGMRRVWLIGAKFAAALSR